jgi:hypothetical protein
MVDANIRQYYFDRQWIYKNGDLNANFQFFGCVTSNGLAFYTMSTTNSLLALHEMISIPPFTSYFSVNVCPPLFDFASIWYTHLSMLAVGFLTASRAWGKRKGRVFFDEKGLSDKARIVLYNIWVIISTNPEPEHYLCYQDQGLGRSENRRPGPGPCRPLPCSPVSPATFMGWDWVHLALRPLFGLLYQPQMIDDDNCEAIGGMRIGRENRNTRRKPALVSLCPPQIPHDLTRAGTRAAAMESRQLITWAMAWPCSPVGFYPMPIQSWALTKHITEKFPLLPKYPAHGAFREAHII